MIKILEKQKVERDTFLSKEFIPREQQYLKDELLRSKLIKIITGPRRAGKSTFLFLLLKGIDFIYVNFDEVELIKLIKNKDEFLDCLHSVYGNTKTIVFDEIQNLSEWDMFLNKLHRNDYNVFITGSNSNLLSGEFASSLTGRYRTVKLFPFSFQEHLKVLEAEKENPVFMLRKILVRGGFPDIVVRDEASKVYFDDLISAVIFKDIAKRHRIQYPERIEMLINYLLSNVCHEINYAKTGIACGIKNHRTLIKYLQFIENSYLFFFLDKFSYKPLVRLVSDKKIFCVDNGFISSKNFSNSPDNGMYFENYVFTELIKKGLKPNSDLLYYKTKNGKEVDFVVKSIAGPEQLIQVCFDISNPKTEKREVAALSEASKELNCNKLLIITPDVDKTEIVDSKTIQFVSIGKWALTNEKMN